MENTSYIVYVDGSYCPNTRKFTYACVFLQDNQVKHKIISKGIDKTGLNNNLAELNAAMRAVKFAKKLNANIKIYYDCKAIKYFINNSPKKKHRTKYYGFILQYQKFMKENKDYFTLKKVKGHSGDQWNTYVDRLAYKALRPA